MDYIAHKCGHVEGFAKAFVSHFGQAIGLFWDSVQQSDNDAAEPEQLQKAKQHLFNLIYEQQAQFA